MMRLLKYLGGLAAAAMIAGHAQAANYDLTLTGDISDFSNYQIPFNGLVFNEYSIPLSGLDSTDAITVSQGDTIDASVSLNTAYTIPASQVYTFFELDLGSASFPAENTGVNGTLSFYDAGNLVATFNSSSTTSNQLSFVAAANPPYNVPITFDSFNTTFTINSLATPATLESASATYGLVSAAPEPTTWTLMLLGLGGVGTALRTQRRREGLRSAMASS
jgi:hypothetical protein